MPPTRLRPVHRRVSQAARRPAWGRWCRCWCNRRAVMRHRIRSVRRMRGVVAVEFALLSIPMIILLLGIAEFGHAFYEYNTLVKSVRDATRLLSAYDPTA